MKTVQLNDVRNWFSAADNLAEYTNSIGQKHTDPEFLESALKLPLHLQFLIERLEADDDSAEFDTHLESIPFYSLCRGLFLPLSMMNATKAAQVFGLRVNEPPDTAGRETLVAQFFDKDVGLTLTEKLGCVLGDVFLGKKSTVQRDSLLRLLMSLQMSSRRDLLDRLTRVGDVAVLFAENRPTLRGDNPLSAAEVVRTLRFIPQTRLTQKFNVLRSLIVRCGKLEAYFIAKLLLRKAGLGFEYQGPMLANLLAAKFDAPAEQVGHAMALTDAFKVARVLTEEGVDGLKKIQLQPLVPVRPTLAGGTTDDIEHFPVWVERKYDGIRLMLHKSTDNQGSVLCGAYTRNRGDWLEQIPGLDASIKLIPARNCIVDGELYGTLLDMDAGVRPASVYEVYAALQGETLQPVSLKFAAFDLVYLNGRDHTNLPLNQRRQWLSNLFAGLSNVRTPIPLSVSEGQLANSKDDLNRLFHHFRAQGYEGIITKDLNSPYLLAARDPHWRKRKPEITLDLVLLGATFAVTEKERAGVFGSYVIGAKTAKGGYQIVGDVAGVDRVRDAEIQGEIMREGLATGTRIERPSASGARPGIELRPSIVVTIKFEGIARDQVTGELSLRDPKIAVIRSDKSAMEADTLDSLREIHLRQRVG
ncbi:MAG: hypothetical protein O3A00_17865 [Planctomycetota bacterium]|nr:hypothetical protein [Planctomycetota bacterium]